MVVFKKSEQMKMTTYPGMQLGGEVRESISLDEDDLSDVEDEVFIRDGKNGYKLAEELNVKRPLMAPRRRPKQNITLKLKNKPPCRAFCKPCCYVFVALSVLIGLIVLVVVLVSIFPLPLDRLRDWIIRKSNEGEAKAPKLLPCNNFKVNNVWSVNLPKLTSESPVRLLDVNNDGFQDVIFGFGTGDNINVMQTDIFCPIFLGVPYPCDGGIIALDGTNGNIIWRHWLNDTIFNLHCTADLNADNQDDCLAVGADGTITTINSKNGSTIWQLNTGKINVFVANFIPDQNSDNVSDILASHTALEGKDGHLIILSGKTGEEIKRINTPNGAKTFFMPQLLKQNETSTVVLIGTGSPSSPGNLSSVPLKDLLTDNLFNNTKTVYEEKSKGIFTQAILADITGDDVFDIIMALYNSTVVAFDGKTFSQIWNFTVPNGETNVSPIPGYFNSDDIPDFMVIYKKFDSILGYHYTETYILDGKSGKPIYPAAGKSITSQINGVILSAEGYGFDSYVYWTSECVQNNGNLNKNCLQQENASTIFHLNALNQFHDQPGFIIYDSANASKLEFNNTKSAIKHIKEYYTNHPKPQYTNNNNIINNPGQSEVNENYNVNPRPIDVKKYGSSSFRHKDNRNGIIKDFSIPNQQFQDGPKYDTNYEQEDPDWADDMDPALFYDAIPYNQKPNIPYNANLPDKGNDRDPRSKQKASSAAHIATNRETKSKKKNLSENKYGIYDYQNIKNARSRLSNDINNTPTNILKDTYFKNEESRLKKSRFEQRDINDRQDRIKENEEIKKIIEKQKESMKNMSYSLWDLESEKEEEEKENNLYRAKRDVDVGSNKIRKISSIGAVLNPINATNSSLDSIDLVFIVYWQQEFNNQKELLKMEIQECIDDKLRKSSEDNSPKTTTIEEQKAVFQAECNEEQTNMKNEFDFFNDLFQLKLGQMTVYRINIKCECENLDSKKEKCPKFLPYERQSWPQYLGKLGDGVFQPRKMKKF
ncbi:unnamed protein product [Brassicogethes aeneus]|uniref:FAM234A/B beta-propeller domain-containing protein n=1 Tax=Brassicogethes aeneus TaxID=1431903 RepID=A0A9P0AQX3_BRAAE|nr:unnamed protein product [Brassicogethes aeneus]